MCLLHLAISMLCSVFLKHFSVFWNRGNQGINFAITVGMMRGRPDPLGVTWGRDGSVNFALYSLRAENVVLCLYEAEAIEPTGKWDGKVAIVFMLKMFCSTHTRGTLLPMFKDKRKCHRLLLCSFGFRKVYHSIGRMTKLLGFLRRLRWHIDCMWEHSLVKQTMLITPLVELFFEY
ncbi:hypothetical protein KC19_VG062600 [Ceratodon purpureus]|uniref:Uncharacterized protein n=1 Tax=Ceratodon purpureus TaxID=3225 RepID=A0A8T0HMJ9_CERPU|nr:hypothetical protein KC19_VG062600 [Ceratodon purpureus]